MNSARTNKNHRKFVWCKQKIKFTFSIFYYEKIRGQLEPSPASSYALNYIKFMLGSLIFNGQFNFDRYCPVLELHSNFPWNIYTGIRKEFHRLDIQLESKTKIPNICSMYVNEVVDGFCCCRLFKGLVYCYDELIIECKWSYDARRDIIIHLGTILMKASLQRSNPSLRYS